MGSGKIPNKKEEKKGEKLLGFDGILYVKCLFCSILIVFPQIKMKNKYEFDWASLSPALKHY